MNLEVAQLKRSQINVGTEILVDAFKEEPMFRYLFPQANREKENGFKGIFKLALHYSQPYTHTYTTVDSLKGVAAWIPPKHSSFNLLQLLPTALALPFQLGWHHLGQIISIFSKAEEHHKRNMPQPHWYLMLLGVASVCQGQGIGGLLLRPVLNQADMEGYPCYLETSTEGAVRFYQRYGFEVIRKEQLQANAPYLWMMKREPRLPIVT